MRPSPCLFTAPRAARPLAIALALALAWPGLPALAQEGMKGPPMGYVTDAKLAEANLKLLQATEALTKERATAKAAQQAAEQAQARAEQAQARAAQAERAAAEAQANKAAPEALAALRKERDQALAEAKALRAELAQAADKLKRQGNATADLAAAASELDKLRRQTQDQQATIGTLRGQVAAKDRALAAAAAATATATSAAAAASALAPAIAPAPASAVAATSAAPKLPADLSELSVPGCGDACPSFVLLPNPGPVTLGAGSEALRVNFAHRFAMANTETTVGQWKAFVNDSGYKPVKADKTHCNWNDSDYASNDRLPVRCVNVIDAEAYVAWFARKYAAQLGVRIASIGLPSELEWEFAARGGRYTQAYLWPDNASDAEKCRHAQISACEGDAKPVHGRLKNGYGLYDMIGNVWEWTASPGRDQRSALPSNGLEAPTGVSGPRSVRGASFFYYGGWLALSFRYRFTPGYRYSSIGFRLVARIAP